MECKSQAQRDLDLMNLQCNFSTRAILVYTETVFFYFQDSVRRSIDPNKLSDFLMTCKKTLKENPDIGSNEYVKVLFSKDKGKLLQVPTFRLHFPKLII